VLINLKISLPVLVMISTMPVPICNRFHSRRANNGNITSFLEGVPLFDAHVRREPLTQGNEILSHKTRVVAVVHSKNFVIIALTVLIQLRSVTDRQMDA